MTVEIPSSLLDELTREVNALSEAAQRQASIAIGQVIAEWDGEDVADLRTAAFAVIDALLSTYTDLSAARAAEFYDASREAQTVRRKYRAVVDSRRDPKATEGAIRAIVQFAADGDVERFRREALDRVDTEMRRAANQCVAYNAGRDPAKPLYARVPVGETCGFCLMLASFGFQYTSESAASHSHRKCNCRVVPSFGDATVRGYDPEQMYGRFNDCLSTLGGRDGIRAEWDALPKEYRDNYIAKHENKAGDAFDAYVNKRVSDEIETRDPEWFRDGKVPTVEFASEQVEKRATDAEKGTAARLAEHVVKPMFIQDYEWIIENGRKRKVGRPDLENGIEIKTLGTSQNAYGAMKNYLASTSGKKGVRCMVVDNSVSLYISDDDLIEAAGELVGEYPDVPAVRLLLKSGTYLIVK